MPYKDKERQKQAQREHYQNKILYLQRSKERRLRFKGWFLALTQNDKCLFCPEDLRECIDYHHVFVEEKDLAISDIVHNKRSRPRLLKELKKCIPVCANCHRKIHAGIVPQELVIQKFRELHRQGRYE
jgi:hypothetical protein